MGLQFVSKGYVCAWGALVAYLRNCKSQDFTSPPTASSNYAMQADNTTSAFALATRRGVDMNDAPRLRHAYHDTHIATSHKIALPLHYHSPHHTILKLDSQISEYHPLRSNLDIPSPPQPAQTAHHVRPLTNRPLAANPRPSLPNPRQPRLSQPRRESRPGLQRRRQQRQRRPAHPSEAGFGGCRPPQRQV